MTHPGKYAVCIIGLGAMGMGAARSCLRAGLTTYGADLNPQALAVLQQAGAKQTAPSARDFATELDAVLLLVVNAAQVKQILFGEQGLAPKLRPGTAVMVSSTISADDAKQIQQRLLDYGLPMLDAPVSGGAAKAEEGQMTVMAAGTDATFERLQPVLDAIAGKVYRIGETIGLGATVKIIHQLLAGVHIAAGAEAMALAARAGIPLDVMYDVVTTPPATPGCSKTACVTWSTATMRPSQLWISSSRIWGWWRIPPRRCTSRCRWPPPLSPCLPPPATPVTVKKTTVR